MIFMQHIRDYVDHLGTLYTHIKSYRAAFYAHNIAFSTILSLDAVYVTPQFLLPSQLATIVSELASVEIFRGTKLSQDKIRAGQEDIFY